MILSFIIKIIKTNTGSKINIPFFTQGYIEAITCETGHSRVFSKRLLLKNGIGSKWPVCVDYLVSIPSTYIQIQKRIFCSAAVIQIQPGKLISINALLDTCI